MSTTIKNPASFLSVPSGSDWEKKEYIYTGDDLIDAYLRGRKEGEDHIRSILKKQFIKNLETAQILSERMLQEATERKIDFSAIHIKADNISRFTALFIANLKDYLSEDFSGIYLLARQLRKEAEGEDLYITFSFLPDSDSLSESCLDADGYFLKYDKRHTEA